MINLLIENQLFHEFMYESYPQNYRGIIEKYKSDFLERLADREKQEKWVNIEELVAVNEKLRKRLKLA
jgi:uncharacterized protein (DUF2267 family)